MLLLCWTHYGWPNICIPTMFYWYMLRRSCHAYNYDRQEDYLSCTRAMYSIEVVLRLESKGCIRSTMMVLVQF